RSRIVALPDQAAYRHVIVHSLADPQTLAGRLVDIDAAVEVDRVQRDLLLGSSLRELFDRVPIEPAGLRQPLAVRCEEREAGVLGTLNGKAALVNERVMECAEANEIRELGRAAVRPMNNVMIVNETRAPTAGEAATAVAGVQRPL